MKIMWLLLGLLCVEMVVTGCGYKGDLVLPGHNEKPRSPTAQPSPP